MADDGTELWDAHGDGELREGWEVEATTDAVAEVVRRGVEEGWPARRIAEALRERFRVLESRAKYLARDEVGEPIELMGFPVVVDPTMEEELVRFGDRVPRPVSEAARDRRPCFAAHPETMRLCQRVRGHPGWHHCSYPGGVDEWSDEPETEEGER